MIPAPLLVTIAAALLSTAARCGSTAAASS